jgi:TonB family protein
MPLFLLKLTIFLLTGLVALLATRNAAAGRRHLLCIATLSGSLLLPLGTLMPATPIVFRLGAASKAVAQRIPASHVAGLSWLSLIFAIWMAGSALLVLRLALGYWRLARIRNSGSRIDTRLFTADINVPMVSGLFHPSILLPGDFAQWPEAQQTAAIRHEQAHIERGDLWANLIANIACAVYWFHPLVWKLNSQLRMEQEAACDAAVINSGFDRTAYAEALLDVARRATPAIAGACAMASGADLKSRIVRLFDSGLTSHQSIKRISSALACVAVALIALSTLGAQTVYKVGGDITIPRLLDKVEPEYTEEARADKIQGTVMLRVTIRADGTAHDISVLKSLDPGLDRKAAEAVEQWHFAPATLKGEPVAVEATIEVNFKLL